MSCRHTLYANIGFRVVEVSGPGFDSDHDGVPDSSDNCPNTPTGEAVDANGCSCSQKTCDDSNSCTTDTCDPATASCVFTPDLTDTDNDGVLDCQDQCPDSPPGSWVDQIKGCPTSRADLDRDGDVDQDDFGILQRCTSGPNIPADPNCQ